MPQRYDRFWLHDKQKTCAKAEVWRASMGSDPYAHAFYVRLIRVPLGEAQGQNLFERARQQAVLCQAIRHPHILQVYAWGTAAAMGWLAVEHPDGYDLDALVQTLRRRRLRIPVPLAVHIAMQGLRALDFLHQHQLLHAGLTARGLFLGPRNQVKLATPTSDLPFGFHAPAMGTLAALPPTKAVGQPETDVWQMARLLQSLLATQGAGEMASPNAASCVPLVPAVPASLARVLQQVLAPRSKRRRIADAATFYRHLAATDLADAMPGCAPLLRYWVQTAASPRDVAHQVGAAPAWTQAPMRALFGAPKHLARPKSLLRRIMRA